MAYQDLFPQNTVCNLRRHCIRFPHYLELTFQKALLIMLLQKVWKTHNKIIRLLAWMMGMGHFFSLFKNRARNQLCLCVNQAELSLKFASSQDMTGQSTVTNALEFIAKHKQWLVWSGLVWWQKSCKGKFRPLCLHVPRGVGSPHGFFRALDGPTP